MHHHDSIYLKMIFNMIFNIHIDILFDGFHAIKYLIKIHFKKCNFHTQYEAFLCRK